VKKIEHNQAVNENPKTALAAAKAIATELSEISERNLSQKV